MRYALPIRSVLPAVATLLLAGCGDSPSGPSEADRTAEQLAQLADSLADRGDIRSTVALLIASDAVRSGAPPRRITVTLDGETSPWTGIAMRMSLSPTACEQLLERMPDFPGIPVDESWCAPTQHVVAWQGAIPEAARLLSFVGDTGLVEIGFSGEFYDEDSPAAGMGFGMLRELDRDALWLSDSGSMRSTQSGTDGPCPQRPGSRGGDSRLEARCELARFEVTLGGRFLEIGVDPAFPGPETPLVPISSSHPTDDWEQQRISIARQTVTGIHVHILRLPPMPVTPVPGLRVQAPSPGAAREYVVMAAARRFLAR